jgi:hypothetical protein
MNGRAIFRQAAVMQTFAEFMAESFESSVPLRWDHARASVVPARFSVDSVTVTVNFERRRADGPWHVVFEVDRGQGTELVYSAFAIFNGVFQAVEEFISVREPETVVFATKRDDLAGIYRSYLRKEARKLAELGYRLEGPIKVDPYMEFMLQRDKPSSWKK